MVDEVEREAERRTNAVIGCFALIACFISGVAVATVVLTLVYHFLGRF